MHALVTLTALAFLVTAASAQDGGAPALRGLDPVLLTQGEEQAGRDDLTVQHGAYRYRFRSVANRDTFRADPERYEIQFGGGCARMGPLSGPGDPDRFTVHDGRIFIFASDQCRQSFLARTGLFFDPDQARPEPTAAAAAHGRALLGQAITAHGGEDRLRALRTLRYTRSHRNGETQQDWRVFVGFPSRLRIDHDYRQSNQIWRYAKVSTGAAGFFLEDGSARAMHASGHREFVRTARRDPILALRHAVDHDDVVVAGNGKANVHGVAVDRLTLWSDGIETTFGLGQDGRIRTATWRGRGPTLWFGEMTHVFDDYVEHAGVMTPTRAQVWFDGKRAKARDEQREQVAFDAALPADCFTAPR